MEKAVLSVPSCHDELCFAPALQVEWRFLGESRIFFFFSNGNSNFNNISTWKRPRKTEKLTKITETLTLKYSLQPKTKEDVGIGVWDFKREEGNSLGDGKADV